MKVTICQRARERLREKDVQWQWGGCCELLSDKYGDCNINMKVNHRKKSSLLEYEPFPVTVIIFIEKSNILRGFLC